MNVLAAGSGPSPFWYLTRGAGVVALLLLTASVVLGIVDFSRWRSDRWPRFVTDALHRNVSLLALAVVALHIVTTVADGFAPIRLQDAIIPPRRLPTTAPLERVICMTTLRCGSAGPATWSDHRMVQLLPPQLPMIGMAPRRIPITVA